MDRTQRGPSALAHPAFALVWAGALVSNLGNFVESTSQAWLVYDQSRSPVWSAVLQLGTQFPCAVLALPAGLLADRVDRRKLVLGLQLFLALAACAQAACAHLGWTSPGVVATLVLVEGIALGAIAPIWQTLLPGLVARDALGSAFAWNSAQFNAARLAGPLLGAAISSRWGAARAFDLNVASFAVVLVALATVRPRTLARAAAVPVRAQLLGLRQTLATRPALARLVLVGAAFSFAAFPMLALLPALADRALGGRVGTYSTLVAAMGAGAIGGAALVGTLVERLGRARVIGGACLVAAAALTGLSLARIPEAAIALVVLFGVAWCVFYTAQAVGVQALAPEELRGRVVGANLAATYAAGPIGQLLAGVLASTVGLGATLAGAGLLLALVAIGWSGRRLTPRPSVTRGQGAAHLTTSPQNRAK